LLTINANNHISNTTLPISRMLHVPNESECALEKREEARRIERVAARAWTIMQKTLTTCMKAERRSGGCQELSVVGTEQFSDEKSEKEAER
jgi:hypothetical protein